MPITKVYVNEHIGGSGSSLGFPTRSWPERHSRSRAVIASESELFAVLAGVGFASVNIADVSSY